MQKEQIIKLQNALNVLLQQIENHQQSKTPVLEVNHLIQQAQKEEEFNFRVKVLETLENLSAAICDPFGLGKLNLMLKNARVPTKYYDIFYQMLGFKTSAGGGI